MDASLQGKRGLYKHALPEELCQELLFILNSLAVIGYRPHVRSLTLYEMLLAQPQLLPVLARARQIIWDRVEELFDLPCQVWPETTSLISWTAGASIGWHHDSNRPYLARRHFSAVAYLNTQGQDFDGGTFCFQSGQPPLRVNPSAGMLLVYTADDSSVHCVEEVTAGDRCTLTMWFTLDPEHQEDTKVLSKLQSAASSSLPSTMYVKDDGLDIRLAEIQQRFGLQVRQCQPSVSLKEQQPSLQGLGQPPGQQQREEQQQQRYEHMAQSHGDKCCTVQCCMHGCGQCSTHFDSLQEAVMAIHMLAWKGLGRLSQQPAAKGDVGGRQHHHGSTAAAAGEASRSWGLEKATDADKAKQCSCCSSLQRLRAAQQQLQAYLQASQQIYDELLPVWGQLGTLVPQAASIDTS